VENRVGLGARRRRVGVDEMQNFVIDDMGIDCMNRGENPSITIDL